MKARGQHHGICERCGAPFVGYRTKRFCSRSCSLAKYRQAHREESRRWTAAYRRRYPDRVEEQNRAAYPRRKSYQQEWRRQHPERVKEYWRKHRSLYPERRNEDQRRSYQVHAEKRRAENARWRNDIANILPACRPCNARKGLAPLELFKARLRKLVGQ